MRTGLHSPGLSPAGIFKMQGGRYIFIFAWLDHHWVKFCEIIGRPELGHDPRFIDNPSRVKNRAAITEIIEHGLANVPRNGTMAEVRRAARIPSAPNPTLEEAVDHPHDR